MPTSTRAAERMRPHHLSDGVPPTGPLKCQRPGQEADMRLGTPHERRDKAQAVTARAQARHRNVFGVVVDP